MQRRPFLGYLEPQEPQGRRVQQCFCFCGRVQLYTRRAFIARVGLEQSQELLRGIPEAIQFQAQLG